jgi:D-alanyl-D-alanine-carboxypeptidase/D-alanyl-D-alanine-endopeptidase
MGTSDWQKTAPTVTGYNDHGIAMPYFNLPSMQASAGLKYGTADMLKYLSYLLAAKAPAVRLSQQPNWGNPDESAVAFNWNLDGTLDSQRRLRASGGSFGFSSYCELYPERKLGVVLLANESDPTTNSHLQEIARQLVLALYGTPPGLRALERGLQAQDYRDAFTVYKAVKNKQPELNLTESYVNSWGYQLLREGKTTHALELFKLNVQLHPAEWNPHDSLAETYEQLGNKPLAIENYRRSVALNPQNTNGMEHLKKLEGR